MKKKLSLIDEWLRRAQSNFEKAKAGRVSEGILFEDLCFDCQQAVEKSLKAFHIYLDIPFPMTHSITRLLENIEKSGIELPQHIKESIILTDYAVNTRYPGDYEPVSEQEYLEAVTITENVIKWIDKKIKNIL